MPEQIIPIIKHPDAASEKSVIVSIPHYGTEPIPDIRPEDYSDPDFVRLPWGYADTFAADVYGGAHEYGAYVVATPYSRLFVDVNRRRDDFTCEEDVVTSTRGVFRTHTRKGKAIFAQPMEMERAEQILSRYYDPFHDGLRNVIEEVRDRHDQVLLLDMHTASPNRLGDHEVVVGTRGGATADRAIIDRIVDLVSAAGVEVHENIPGYAGGHIVRRYGEDGDDRIQAIQIEINAGLLMTTPREELVPRLIRGERPEIDAENVDRMRRCLETIVRDALG